jgi:hypothetical protein
MITACSLASNSNSHSILPRGCVYEWTSESYDGAERDSQIVVGTLVEVDLIARFEAKADRTERRFNSRTGVESGIHIGRTQIENWADNVNVGQQAGAQSKIHEPCFQSGKGMKMALTADEGWTEQSMRDSDRCTLDRLNVAGDYVAISFVKVQSVVVGEFSLEHYIAVHAKSNACADSEVVGAGLGNAQRVQEYSEFNAFLSE